MDDQTMLAIRNTIIIGSALIGIIAWARRKWRER